MWVTECFLVLVRRCKEKWKNIRTVFRRHLFGLGGSSQKEYYMTEVLQFLVPLLRENPKNNSGNLPYLTYKTEEQDNMQQVTSETDETVSEVPYVEEDNHVVNEYPEISYGVPNRSTCSSTSSTDGFIRRQLGKRKANSSLDDAVIDYVQLKSRPAERQTIDVDSDAESDEYFLLSLKKDMREMNARQKRTFKKRIFDLIEEVLDDHPPC